MYVNGEMRPSEIIPGIGGRGMKENDGWDECNYDVM
jgi:hypothetical protein